MPPHDGNRITVGIVDVETIPSGITRYVTALLEGLDHARFEPVLFCRSDGPYRSVTDVRVVHLPGETAGSSAAPQVEMSLSLTARARRGARQLWRRAMPQPVKHLTGFLREAQQMSRVFRQNPVDVLHVQIVSNSRAAVAGRWAGVPAIVGTYHLDPARTRLHEWVPQALTARCLDHGVAVSTHTMGAWAKRRATAPRVLSTIANGVEVVRYRRRRSRADARRALGIPAQADPVIAVVGRLEEQKGHRYLLDACARLPEHPNLHLLLAGDGTLRDELETHARVLGLAARVSFVGHCSDVQLVLEAADVFALPSLWEAMPFALLEAMAVGLPVVATDVAGVPELVVAGETGLLVPPRDADALAAALRRVAPSPVERQRMANAGRARVSRHFSLTAMIEQTQRTYRELLDRKSARRGTPGYESWGIAAIS